MGDHHADAIGFNKVQVDPLSQTERHWQRHCATDDIHEVVNSNVDAGRNVLNRAPKFFAVDGRYDMIFSINTPRTMVPPVVISQIHPCGLLSDGGVDGRLKRS